MISYAFDPPEEADVKRSYATSATTEVLLWDHDQLDYAEKYRQPDEYVLVIFKVRGV